MRRAWVDAAAVMAAWSVMLLTECVAVLLLWPEQFSASWEYGLARRLVLPIALASLAPASLVSVGVWEAAVRSARGAVVSRSILGIAGVGGACAFALGVSNGRHFTNLAVRAPCVLAVMAAGGFAVWAVAPAVGRLASRPSALAATGAILAVGAWAADAFLLARLYPAFHDATFVLSLLGGALVGLSLRPVEPRPRLPALLFAGCVTGIVALCAWWSPRAARELLKASNLRIALVEHAPFLGRAVLVAAHLAPSDETTSSASAMAGQHAEIVRSLDWTGHDLVLLSVDALRADHVSAYGYSRATTPNIYALANEGTAFDSAYCPTPHTSYSLTSMMTGKYLRPLMALGLGEDSETWAQHLRRYGWRTAAFYPPAVFFIDESRFPTFEREHMGFEYAKVEFADPELREKQVADYLGNAPRSTPLFLWVHFFEPHEPYVLHANHRFSGGASSDIDAYDGEIATADDGIGRIVRLVRAERPGAVFIVTADHGEEFGEHGGRYHGTTVYEEQARVPLVVLGPGVQKGRRIPTVVQTIDILPTVLSALGIPRPARLRGRDLGPLLAGDSSSIDDGFAFAETDEYALVAVGGDRLVCERRLGACSLFRPGEDPNEHRDLGPSAPARLAQLRAMLRGVERDHGRYESSAGPVWPEALRRGMQGDIEAGLEVASLLDDADVVVRRKAAEVCFDLRAPSTTPALRRALADDEDEEVRRWTALALTRLSEPIAPLVDVLAKDANRDWRRRAALVLAERGEERACDELSLWWDELVSEQGSGPRADGEPARLPLDLAHAEELLAATRSARCRAAVSSLVRALEDVRARPSVADTLGALGDPRARAPLLDLLANEPYLTARPHEARALLALSAGGSQDKAWAPPVSVVALDLSLPLGPARLVVLLSNPDALLDASLDESPAHSTGDQGAVRYLKVGSDHPARVRLWSHPSTGGVAALWVTPDRAT